MDGFTYYNIFETKGIEYLAIIAFFMILIPFWFLLNRRINYAALSSDSANINASRINIPQGLFFSKNHTWAHLEKSGLAKVGIDDLLARLTGNVEIQFLRSPGDRIKKGEIIARVGQESKWLQIVSPLEGEIVSTNRVIVSNSILLNQDPYNKGWMFKIRPKQWTDDTSSYYLASEATSWAFKEFERVKDFLAVSASKQTLKHQIILQDGGEICCRPLNDLPAEIWNDFEKEFLSL